MRPNMLFSFLSLLLIAGLSSMTFGFIPPAWDGFISSGGLLSDLAANGMAPRVNPHYPLITLEQTGFYRPAAKAAAVVEEPAPHNDTPVSLPPTDQMEGRKGSDSLPSPPPPAEPVSPPPQPEPAPEPAPPPVEPEPAPPPAPPAAPLSQVKLGWQFVYMDNAVYVSDTAAETGFNVYAPVVYFVVNDGGNLRLARHKDFNRGVLQTAAANGYQVWTTVQLFGAANAGRLFGNPAVQSALIADLIQKALTDGAHGINVDFENMGQANRDGFTRFMEELYLATREKNLLLSVDVTRPGSTSWSSCYDHGALSRASDYVILMAYDEFTAGSPVPGPVASLGWMESSINALLDRGVPADKLVAAVPFYSRVWVGEGEVISVTEDAVLVTAPAINLRAEPNTYLEPVGLAYQNTLLPYLATVEGENIDGNTAWFMVGYDGGQAYVSAAYARLAHAGEIIQGSGKILRSFCIGLQHTLAMVDHYDPDSATSYYEPENYGRQLMADVTISDDRGLTLITYRNSEGLLCTVWAENYDSLRRRYQLVVKYGLAGVAGWSLDWQSNVSSPWLSMEEKAD